MFNRKLKLAIITTVIHEFLKTTGFYIAIQTWQDIFDNISSVAVSSKHNKSRKKRGI